MERTMRGSHTGKARSTRPRGIVVPHGRDGEVDEQLYPLKTFLDVIAERAWAHRLWLLSGAVALAMMLNRDRWGLAVAVGATWCALAILWAAWRDIAARPAWVAMGIGLLAFAFAG